MTFKRYTRSCLGTATALFILVWGQGHAEGRTQAQGQGINPHDLALVNRLTWGETTSTVFDISRQGPEQWLDQQLHPSADAGLPDAAQSQIDAMAISQTPMKDLVIALSNQNKTNNQITDPEQKKVAQQAYQQALNDLGKQAATRSLLRDLYSKDQVQAQMTWFWFNHFNVHLYKADIRAMIGDYEDTAIRPFALGRFRDLLEATLRHPAMLRYLDNDQNAANHINENYARELMELHTLGVGSGYSQKDVQELARILTGVGVDLSLEAPKLKPAYQALFLRSGLFEFNPNRHDFGDKIFLGHTIKGRGFAEVEEALDILARDPATARHVSAQIASYYLGETPSEDLVRRMAETFSQTDGDIAQVLRTLFKSHEFNASLGHAFKDPVHYAISAVRLAYDEHVVLNTGPIQGWINRMSEGLYNHQTPDGYPMSSSAWNGPGQLAVRFEVARQIGSGASGLFKPEGPGAIDHPGFPQIQNALYFEGLAQTLGPSTRTTLDQATSQQEWNTLFLSSPEFMLR